MSMFYDQDAEDERTDRDQWGFLDGPTTMFAPGNLDDWEWGTTVIPAADLHAGPFYADPDPTPQTPYMPARGPAHRSLSARRQRRMRAAVTVAILALVLAVVALLVVPPKSRNAAKIKLNTVQTVPPTTRAPATTLPPAIAPGPAPSPSTAVTAAPTVTLPPSAPSAFGTTNGGTASNTSGAAGVPVYYGAGGGPSGNKVPTVVDGVTMPHPGQAPTAAQVRAAGTIPYVCPSRCDGINWAAIDALAGEGWGP